MSQEILSKIKQAIEGYKDNPGWEEIGTITEVGDGIIKISGLTKVQSQEVLEVQVVKSAPTKDSGETIEKVKAVALNLEEDAVGALVLGEFSHIKSGYTVKRTKQLLSITVHDHLLCSWCRR
jgi:F-type H+-transporting ATPase subunit alpha